MTRSKSWRPIAIWALRILLGGSFLYFGSLKLAGNARMVEAFAKVGVGQWFRYLTGVLEVVGAVLMLVPRSSIVGALVLLVVTAGAFVAQVAILHEDWIHVVVIAGLLLLLVWLQRRALPRDGGSGLAG